MESQAADCALGSTAFKDELHFWKVQVTIRGGSLEATRPMTQP